MNYNDWVGSIEKEPSLRELILQKIIEGSELAYTNKNTNALMTFPKLRKIFGVSEASVRRVLDSLLNDAEIKSVHCTINSRLRYFYVDDLPKKGK